jgi:hypothetical protein
MAKFYKNEYKKAVNRKRVKKAPAGKWRGSEK